jgi:serine/threonine protein kinase
LENVMLKTDGHVVLGDFDLAVRLPVEAGKGNAFKTRGVCGTLPYMAPEVLRNMEYSYAVDWFAYGVFLHVFYLDKVRFVFSPVGPMFTTLNIVSLAGRVRTSSELSEGDGVYAIAWRHLPEERVVRRPAQRGGHLTLTFDI